jgi:FAD/FMN-containing dehydrogenase
MNKIAHYLNEHILGEVNSDSVSKQKFSHDGSILSITPEIIVHPRVTNDIRKVARFSWQLAEKGHILPVTIRGAGSNKTGAAIGKGIIVNTMSHLNKIIFTSYKNNDQFIHLQPGTNYGAMNETLKSQGLVVPVCPNSSRYSTVGGAVADNLAGVRFDKTNNVGDQVLRLEIVLSNGDLIETSRISKHELNKKKGLQTFEGEIYRKIDGIIEDNQQIIADKIANNPQENVGYTGIAKVKDKKGSFDLTPLLVGSQGTLGLISEIVLKAQTYSDNTSVLVATFGSPESARDAADILTSFEPSVMELIEGTLFDLAHSYGKKYIFSERYQDESAPSVLYVSFNDSSDRALHKKVKQVIKKLSKFETTIYTSTDYSIDELQAVREVEAVVAHPQTKGESRLNIIDGASIPANRREEFIAALSDLANKHHITLPLRIEWPSGIIYTKPVLNLHTVSDKQKTFKLITDYMEIVARYGGSMAADGAEGRLRAMGSYAQLDEDELEIYHQVKAAFDPFGILNTGVKQKSDLKTLVSQLDPDYNNSDFVQYSPYD